LWLSVNGTKVQDGSTSDFIFNVQEVVSYLSQFMSLMPGDIISTGTPQGVGLGFDPPVFLKDGDVIELGVEGLGTAKQRVKAWPGE
jgi:2-keto-4-pentenoate hydratase/2-oxohepta-3-ene-1,7-dioic acid hydratase in catechol pathway